ncbi:MAG TPA: NAD(P)/FAD-dependent oxidoreductase [Candidatus Obscuribacterales bacterium]
MHEFDVIIIGAGGAGMMCAMTAGARGRRVCLIDHSPKIGRKILISGGGRCNFTNIYAGPQNYASRNPHFCKSALSRYTPEDFISMVRKHRISYHEKKLGQLFCDGTADAIVRMLVCECENVDVAFHSGRSVSEINRDDDGFVLNVGEDKYKCQSLVIATGGLSIPKIGATGFGYDVAKKFGLSVVEPFPALVGFNFSPDDLHKLGDLAGVSSDTTVTCNKAAFRENILFTHTGLSGPAILQASLYWRAHDALSIDLLPDKDAGEILQSAKRDNSKALLKNVLSDLLPRRLAERFAQLYSSGRPLAEISDQVLQEFAGKLQAWSIRPHSNFGYAKAEVTRGGVNTDGLSAKTMEAKAVPGLFFIGEVVDVTGQLGGYNFQWAWASGHAAGQVV